jgi:hypothetical protein
MTDEQIEELWTRVTGFSADDERADIAGFARALLSASIADTAGAKPVAGYVIPQRLNSDDPVISLYRKPEGGARFPLYTAPQAECAPREAQPVAWFEAEESCRGMDIRSIDGMMHSTRLHWQAARPKTGNPVWPLYAAPLATPSDKQEAKPIYQVLEPCEDLWSDADWLTYERTDGAFKRIVYAAPLANPSDKGAEPVGSMSDSPLVKKFRRDCWLRNNAYERAARICEAILALGFVGDESADRFEWTAKECARMVRSLKDHEEFASKHEEPND